MSLADEKGRLECMGHVETERPMDKTVRDIRRENLERARAIYDQRLKQTLEPEHNGKVIIVHVETGEYCMNENPVDALDEFESKHPGANYGILRVGHKAMYRFGTLPS
ncbi:MAG: hypothetical protein HY719_11430 [Planctomycetes bacterium]|nr:hypothetical protein [Planctomycetota bacterium]